MASDSGDFRWMAGLKCLEDVKFKKWKGEKCLLNKVGWLRGGILNMVEMKWGRGGRGEGGGPGFSWEEIWL